MKQLLVWLIVILAFAGLLALASARADDARTNRIYAQAHLIGAQSSARQDLLAGLMPYTVLGLAALGGIITIVALTGGVVALIGGVVAIVAMWSERPQAAPPRIIERQMVILMQPGQTRRETWQQLSEIKLLEE